MKSDIILQPTPNILEKCLKIERLGFTEYLRQRWTRLTIPLKCVIQAECGSVTRNIDM